MKQNLRNTILNNLKELPLERKKEINNQIHENLFGSTYWKESKVLGLTLSSETEWDTYEIIRRAWADNKIVAIPVTNEKTHLMKFYLLDSLKDLKEGAYKIYEPINQSTEHYFDKVGIDLMIVPGVVFDRKGYRIGFGKGYFDRYLANFNNKTISLVAEFQIIKQIPTNEYDISVNCLITERGIIKTN